MWSKLTFKEKGGEKKNILNIFHGKDTERDFGGHQPNV